MSPVGRSSKHKKRKKDWRKERKQSLQEQGSIPGSAMGHPDPTNFHFVVKHTWLSAPSAPPRDRMQDREVIAKIKWSRSRARYGTRISKRTRQQPRRNRGKLKGGGCETRSLSAGSLVWISQFKPGTKAGVDSCKQARQAKPGEARMPGAWGLRLLLLIGVAPSPPWDGKRRGEWGRAR
jgi:hypothetical protein